LNITHLLLLHTFYSGVIFNLVLASIHYLLWDFDRISIGYLHDPIFEQSDQVSPSSELQAARYNLLKFKAILFLALNATGVFYVLLCICRCPNLILTPWLSSMVNIFPWTTPVPQSDLLEQEVMASEVNWSQNLPCIVWPVTSSY
jgi:hypothetical protein